MAKYFTAILFFPAFGLVGLIVASFGVRNGNIGQRIGDSSILYMLMSFTIACWVIFLLARFGRNEEPSARPRSHVSPTHLYILFAILVLISCLPLIVYGPPIITGLNRYEFASLDLVPDLRQLDNAITWVFVICLVIRVSPSNRILLWSILAALALLYGDKFSPLARIAFFELIIRLYWKESLRERSALLLAALLGVAVAAGAIVYWWTGAFSDVLTGLIERIGKQASCTIAVADRLGFMSDRASIFWNFYEAQSTGLSFFHEVSRQVSLRSNQSVLGDSFPCVYMALSPNVFAFSALIALSTAIKVLLLKFMFVFLEKFDLGPVSVVVLFLYVRYLDVIIASDRFHLLTHPLFLFSAYFMLLMIVSKWYRQQLSHD